MSPTEKDILAKEKKQVRAFLATIRIENERIGKQAASMLALIAQIRVSYLGINLIIDEFEKKLGS